MTEAFRNHWSSVSLTDEQFAHLFEAGYIQPDVSVIAWAGDEIAGASPVRRPSNLSETF